MSHPTERGSYMQAINTQILKDIEETRTRQLRKANKVKGHRPSMDVVFSASVFFVILLAIIY